MPTPRSPRARIHGRSRRTHAAPPPPPAPEALRFCVVPRWSETLPDGRRIDVRFAVSCHENTPLRIVLEVGEAPDGWREPTLEEMYAVHRRLNRAVFPALSRLQATGELPAGGTTDAEDARTRLIAASVVTTTSLPEWARLALGDSM